MITHPKREYSNPGDADCKHYWIGTHHGGFREYFRCKLCGAEMSEDIDKARGYGYIFCKAGFTADIYDNY